MTWHFLVEIDGVPRSPTYTGGDPATVPRAPARPAGGHLLAMVGTHARYPVWLPPAGAVPAAPRCPDPLLFLVEVDA